MKLTQSQLLAAYIQEHGSVVPAQLCGQYYKGQMVGSEFPKRARELRKKGILISEPEGRFERFRFNPDLPKQFNLLEDYTALEGKVLASGTWNPETGEVKYDKPPEEKQAPQETKQLSIV